MYQFKLKHEPFSKTVTQTNFAHLHSIEAVSDLSNLLPFRSDYLLMETVVNDHVLAAFIFLQQNDIM